MLPVSQAANVAIMCIAACVVLYSWYLYTEQRRLDAKLTAIAGQLLTAQRATQAHVDALSRKVGGVGGVSGAIPQPSHASSDALVAAASAIPMLFATVGECGRHAYCSMVMEEDDEEDEEEEDEEEEDDCVFEDEEGEEEDEGDEVQRTGLLVVVDEGECAPEASGAAEASDHGGEEVTVVTVEGRPPEGLSSKKVEELKAMLRDLGGDTKGTKTVLQERLAEMMRVKS